MKRRDSPPAPTAQARSAQTLATALERVGSGRLVVVTGAGVSVASGIPTFRGTDPGAIWKRDITELGTFAYFRRDPVDSWRWYLSRFASTQGREPNAAHFALAEIERWHTRRGGDYLLVTQNIDTLHEQAGAEHLIKVHGSIDRVRCAALGCVYGAPRGTLLRESVDLEAFLREPKPENLPRCPGCGDLLRQHVLWFDEYYQSHDDYAWNEVQSAALYADLLLFVGTSFSVGVTELFLQTAMARGIPMFSIDPGAEASRHPGMVTIQEPCEELVPLAVRLATKADPA